MVVELAGEAVEFGGSFAESDGAVLPDFRDDFFVQVGDDAAEFVLDGGGGFVEALLPGAFRDFGRHENPPYSPLYRANRDRFAGLAFFRDELPFWYRTLAMWHCRVEDARGPHEGRTFPRTTTSAVERHTKHWR